MAFKGYKKGIRRGIDHMAENARNLKWGRKFMGWDWKRRGSWKKLPPRRHPGWEAYHRAKELVEGPQTPE